MWAHKLAESNGKGHAGASAPAGFLTQHNPGVIKHGKKKKGHGLVLTSVYSAQAPGGLGIQKCQLLWIYRSQGLAHQGHLHVWDSASVASRIDSPSGTTEWAALILPEP